MLTTLALGTAFACTCGVLVALGFLALLSLAERLLSGRTIAVRVRRARPAAAPQGLLGRTLWHLHVPTSS